MKSKKNRFSIVSWLPFFAGILLLYLSGCQSEEKIFQHQAGELARLPVTELKAPSDQALIQWKNDLPLVINLFDYTAGNPCGGDYYPGQGLDGSLYRTYSQKNLEYPIFEFFWEGLLRKGFWTLKNYDVIPSRSPKALAVIWGRITHFEIDSLHQWEKGLERIYWLGLMEVEFDMEGRGERVRFTLSHKFKAPQKKGVDILKILVWGLVDKLVESENFIEKTGILPPGRILRRIKKGPSHEK